MSPAATIAALTWIAVMLIMAGEAALSSFNERILRERGAVEPPEDVYRTMRWAYPACFVAMAIEGALRGPAPPNVLLAGLVLFAFAKALKLAAVSALGVRWTFRVLVVSGAPLVKTGPYRFLRHPNYLAVAGEITGMAMIVFAPVTGATALVAFGWLMLQRIRIEDRALGLRQHSGRP